MSVYSLDVIKKDTPPLTQREQMFSDFDRMMADAVVVTLDDKNKLYYTSKELALVLGYSKRWVVKWRHKLPGAMRVSRQWRFDKTIIDRIAKSGKIRDYLK